IKVFSLAPMCGNMLFLLSHADSWRGCIERARQAKASFTKARAGFSRTCVGGGLAAAKRRGRTVRPRGLFRSARPRYVQLCRRRLEDRDACELHAWIGARRKGAVCQA